jgi:hypothetical protein
MKLAIYQAYFCTLNLGYFPDLTWGLMILFNWMIGKDIGEAWQLRACLERAGGLYRDVSSTVPPYQGPATRQ